MQTENVIAFQYAKISKADIKATALSNGTTYYTDPIQTKYSKGWSVLLVLLTGGSDSVTISLEVSDDGGTFYSPYTTDGSSLTDAGGIATSLTTSSWIDISSRVRLAPWCRFKIVAGANSTMTMKYSQQE